MAMNCDPDFWHRRPLSTEAWEYAALDVLLMIPTYKVIYKQLSDYAKIRLRALSNERLLSMNYDEAPESVTTIQGRKIPLYGVTALDDVCLPLFFFIQSFSSVCFLSFSFFLLFLNSI